VPGREDSRSVAGRVADARGAGAQVLTVMPLYALPGVPAAGAKGAAGGAAGAAEWAPIGLPDMINSGGAVLRVQVDSDGSTLREIVSTIRKNLNAQAGPSNAQADGAGPADPSAGPGAGAGAGAGAGTVESALSLTGVAQPPPAKGGEMRAVVTVKGQGALLAYSSARPERVLVHPAGSPRSWLRKKVVSRGSAARFGRQGSSAERREPGIGTRLVEVRPPPPSLCNPSPYAPPYRTLSLPVAVPPPPRDWPGGVGRVVARSTRGNFRQRLSQLSPGGRARRRPHGRRGGRRDVGRVVRARPAAPPPAPPRHSGSIIN